MLRNRITLVALGALALTAISISSATAHHAQRAKGATMTIVGTNPQVTPSADFPKAGSTFVETHNDTINGKASGQDLSACTVITDGDVIHCNTTITVPRGTLELAFLSHIVGGPIHAAVVGGTGRYAGATGDAVITDDGSAATAVIHLR